MSRDAFDRWLDLPVPGRDAIANRSEMFAGWFWDGQEAPGGWNRVAEDRTVREWLLDRVDAGEVDRADLTATVAGLRAVESAFFAMAEREDFSGGVQLSS